MNKAMEIGFEIVSLAGDARSILLECLSKAKKLAKLNEQEAAKLIKDIDQDRKEASDLINECHVKQTDVLQAEARGEEGEFSYLMVHAQDHLMTTILLREIVDSFIDLYQQLRKK